MAFVLSNSTTASIKFERAILPVLKMEGGYVNDPDDPGGETKYGISKRAYPDLDIKALTIEDAKDIYLLDYWMPLDCDALDWALCLYVFDCGVNSGLRRARQFLDEAPTAELYLARRETFYRGLAQRRAKSRKYLKGWLNRLAHIRAVGEK